MRNESIKLTGVFYIENVNVDTYPCLGPDSNQPSLAW